MFDNLRRRLARLIAPRGVPGRMGLRMYNAAQPSRLLGGFGLGGNTSADAELASSLTVLRNRSRQLMRDSAYAKQARKIIVNNVVGTGVGLQGQVKNTRAELHKTVNDAIETAWKQWKRGANCHTGGALHFDDMERLLLSQVVEAGEILLRKHYRAFGPQRLPFALEVIEPERIVDDRSVPAPFNERTRLGVEVDQYQRPVAYWIREHPGDVRFGVAPEVRIVRVPAAEIIHLRLIDRWPQTRGEPWLHAVIRKLADMDAYSEAEITAARSAACYMGFIETAEAPDGPSEGQTTEGGQTQLAFEPGMFERLAYGEKMNFVKPDRPNTAIADFMRYMLREVAAGAGVSYESISRDYSQGTYSSMRIALLDDRDAWRVLQGWWVRTFREPLHREWLQIAVLNRNIGEIPVGAYAADVERYEAARYKVRGWSWIDPTKEVAAYKEARKAGFISTGDVISQTAGGLDIEDVVDQIEQEEKLFEERGLHFDVTAAKPAPPPAPPPPPAGADEGAAEGEEKPDDDEQQTTRPARVVSFSQAIKA